jgi:hypothetical protein
MPGQMQPAGVIAERLADRKRDAQVASAMI